MLDGVPGLLHEPQERGKVGGLFPQRLHDGGPEPRLERRRPVHRKPLSIVEKAALAVLLGALDIGQVMLNAHPVGEPPQGKGGADEIVELPGAIKGRGIKIDVIVNVALVGMGADEKLVLVLCPAHSRFIADFVGLLGRNLAGGERLADLKEQSATLHGPPRLGLILAFGEQELGVGRGRVAEVSRNSPQLFGVEPIGKPLLHRLHGTFA